MGTYIALISVTNQGEANIQDSVARAAGFREEAAQFGATVKDTYWTLGEWDGVLVFEAPDDETATALMCRLSSKGAVRTHTMRAFAPDEMKSILERAGA